MKISSESKFKINQLITALIARFANLEDEIVTDIYLQPSFQTGELKVYNDDDELLANEVISEFEGLTGTEAVSSVARILRKSLEHKRKEIESLLILKPFSFVLVDEDKETIEDLLLVDDDIVLADEGLLKGLDADLNEFLKKLLSE